MSAHLFFHDSEDYSDSPTHAEAAGASWRHELVHQHTELEARCRVLHGDECTDEVVAAYGSGLETLKVNTARLRELIECPVSPIGCLEIPVCQRECEREESDV